ncbi:MAG: sulfatase-like hydrolase/transferase, partial [Actinomycetota bacterium]
GETLRAAIESSSIEGENDLLFVHEVFPHTPWVRTPTGAVYPDRAGSPGQVDKVWGPNEFLITQGLQRHLLQVGYADLIVGELIDDLEARGVWEDALVVVTADHGAAFESGESPRGPATATAEQIFNVPLFVKLPGQVTGETDDRPASTIDVLPTVVDALDVQGVDLDLDGVSLVGDPRTEPSVVDVTDGPDVALDDIDGLLAVAEANRARLPGEGWRGVAAPGPYGELVGRDLSEFDVGSTERRWSAEQAGLLFDLDLSFGAVPLILTGEMDAVDDAPDALLIGLNGTIAGVVGFEQTSGSDAVTWSALLDESLFVDGTNTLELHQAVAGRHGRPQVGGPAVSIVGDSTGPETA